MSKEAFKALVKKMGADEAFRKTIEQAPTSEEKRKLIEAAGFQFTKADIDALMPGVAGKGELSDKDLEAVAGGKTVEWIGAVAGAAGATVAAVVAAVA